MNIDQFWDLIEECSPHSFDMDLKSRLLGERLASLSPDDLRSFDDHFRTCQRRAYHWPLWDAAAISYSGCGDDSFMDYRSSLITFGRSTFEKALSDPDSLGDLDQPIPRSEEVFGTIHTVVERVLGADYSPSVIGHDEPTGKSIEDETENPESLARIRFPKLSKLSDKPLPASKPRPWWKLW